VGASLLQSGGFKCFVHLLIQADAGDQATANLEDERAPSHGLDAIPPLDVSGVGTTTDSPDLMKRFGATSTCSNISRKPSWKRRTSSKPL
jgi:hypothetical protein